MNLTVGPHPPAVYWRRRAVVAAPVLLILVLFAGCLSTGQNGSSNQRAAAASTKSPAPQQSHACTLDDPCVPAPDLSASASPSPSVPAFGAAVQPSPKAAASLSPSPRPAASTSAAECADKDVALTPVVDQAEYKSGTMPRFKLVISNRSGTPCTMDVGSAQQELVVTRSGQRVWSSDDCSPNHGHDVRTLAPGAKRTYWLTWSGKTSAPGCSAARVNAGPGSYQLTGRLANVRSAAVPFTITA
ncbi:MAG: hypothetical protein JWO79_1459 [Actinomycetia bacterium]|nr:hypothetical protein [Actinomycetes bacterium]